VKIESIKNHGAKVENAMWTTRRTMELQCREAHPTEVFAPIALEEIGKKDSHSANKHILEATHAVYFHHQSRGFTVEKKFFHSE
jgi:hypothetical protein